MKAFLQKLIAELTYNGKSLIVWIMNEIPGMTDYPGLKEALDSFVANPTKSTLGHLIFQALWAGASGHRLLKILLKVIRNR